MRKYLRIFVVVFAFVFLLRSYLPVEINEEDEFYIFIAFTAFATPFCIYEIIQVLKDDKKTIRIMEKKGKSRQLL